MTATIELSEQLSRNNNPCAPAGHTETPEVSIELRGAADALAVMSLWKDIAAKFQPGRLACSWEWTQTWLDHYGDLIPHRFAIGRQQGHICGLCLLTEGVDQREGPFGVKSLHVGTAGEPERDSVCVEYNCLPVQERHQAEFLRALSETVAREPGWDEFCFDGFRAEEVEQLSWGDDDAAYRNSKSHYFDLQSTRDASAEPLSRLGYATRKNIRKNLKAYGKLKTEWADTEDEAVSIFSDMVRLHQARWDAAGRPGAYASERFMNFHRALIRQLLPLNKVGLFRVSRDEEIVGCVQLFIDGNRALCYQGGSAPYEGKRSPGLIVDYLCIEECLRRGYDAYDFLCGDSHHKRKLTTDFNRIVWVRQRRRRLKFVAVDLVRKLKSLLHR